MLLLDALELRPFALHYFPIVHYPTVNASSTVA